jgi:alcohol dehydrogenase class IV
LILYRDSAQSSSPTGHKLGATYAIPHGICSVLTLSETVKLMSANLTGYDLACLATAHTFLPSGYQGTAKPLGLDASSASEEDQRAAAMQVGVAIGQLVDALELKSTLKEYKVPREDLEGIAGKVDEAKPEGSPYDKEQVMEAILNKIYE